MSNGYIILATDYLARCCETKPLPSGSAADIAHFFIHNIVLRQSTPLVVLTDRGTNFMPALTQGVLPLSRTRSRKTAAYHPQNNGLTERISKTIADMLPMYVNVYQATWDQVPLSIRFSYSAACLETTRFTPFSLVHGREAFTMLDAMLFTDHTHSSVAGTDQFVLDAEATLAVARQSIRHQATDAQRYNLHHEEVTYKPGEQVWVWRPLRLRGTIDNLLRHYFGPYGVPRHLSEVNYEVLSQATVRSKRQQSPEAAHVGTMKP